MRRLALLAACAALSMLLATSASAQTAGAAPGLPTNLSATAVGGSLTVTWSAPTADGGATITSYDLQYGEGDGTNLANTTWTVLDEVWTSGSLSYVVSGLKESTEYACRCGPSTALGMGTGRAPSPRRPPTTATRKATATPAALGDDLPGTIDPFDDVDFFSFTVAATTDRCLVVHHWRYQYSRLPLQLERDGATGRVWRQRQPEQPPEFRGAGEPARRNLLRQCRNLRTVELRVLHAARALGGARWHFPQHRDGDHAHLGGLAVPRVHLHAGWL